MGRWHISSSYLRMVDSLSLGTAEERSEREGGLDRRQGDNKLSLETTKALVNNLINKCSSRGMDKENVISM